MASSESWFSRAANNIRSFSGAVVAGVTEANTNTEMLRMLWSNAKEWLDETPVRRAEELNQAFERQYSVVEPLYDQLARIKEATGSLKSADAELVIRTGICRIVQA